MAREKNWSYHSFDEDEDISIIGNYVWDTGTLAWVKQTAGGGGASGPVTIADGADVTQGAKADAAWVSGAGSVISLLKTIASSGAAAGLTDAQLRATPVPVSGPLTDAQIRATPVPVSVGTVPVTGTFFQATQPVSIAATVAVSGPLTDTQLRATPVPISGTVSVGTVPVTGPLTDAQLRAVAVPVSGTVAVTGALTDVQLRASAVAMSVSSIDGEPSLATAQVSVTTTAATLVAARAGRRSLLIVNHGTTDVYLGPATVTTASGLLLPGVKGASVSIPTTGLIQAIVGAGTQTVSYIEVF